MSRYGAGGKPKKGESGKVWIMLPSSIPIPAKPAPGGEQADHQPFRRWVDRAYGRPFESERVTTTAVIPLTEAAWSLLMVQT